MADELARLKGIAAARREIGRRPTAPEQIGRIGETVGATLMRLREQARAREEEERRARLAPLEERLLRARAVAAEREPVERVGRIPKTYQEFTSDMMSSALRSGLYSEKDLPKIEAQMTRMAKRIYGLEPEKTVFEQALGMVGAYTNAQKAWEDWEVNKNVLGLTPEQVNEVERQLIIRWGGKPEKRKPPAWAKEVIPVFKRAAKRAVIEAPIIGPGIKLFEEIRKARRK